MNTNGLSPWSRPMNRPPRIQAALAEVRALIGARYREASFCTHRGEDPDGIYPEATVDVDDLDDVTDLSLDRLIDPYVEVGPPIYVALALPLQRVRADVRRSAAKPILARIPAGWP